MNKLTQKMQQYFDIIAYDYANKRSKPDKKMLYVTPYLKKGMRILDLGCGHGRFFELMPEGVEYIGLDFSKKLLEIAGKKYSKGNFIYGDITDGKVYEKLGKFDAVFCLAVYHHLMDKKTQQKVTKLIFESLNKNGLFMVTVLNFYKKGNWLNHAVKVNPKKYLVPWRLSDGKKVTKTVKRNFYAFEPKELKKLVEEQSFKVEKEFFVHGKNLSDAKEFGIITKKW